MIDKAIVDYMHNHNRLIVPEFGAFIKKEDAGEVVFMEFLKNDDHELTSYLQQLYSLTTAEALHSIEVFLVEVKKQIMYTGGFVLEGLGVLRPGPNNMYRLDYDPNVTQEALDKEIVPKDGEISDSDAKSVVAIESEVTQKVSTPEETSNPLDPGKKVEPLFNSSARDKSVKGLSYGKPNKQAKHQAGKKRADGIMIIAIIVALLAIGVLIYGAMESGNGMNNLFSKDKAVEVVDEIVVPTDDIPVVDQ